MAAALWVSLTSIGIGTTTRLLRVPTSIPTPVGIGTEFHKIGNPLLRPMGMGREWQHAWVVKSNERIMTQGEEADYVGSIYNSGSAALRQTISGLRKGRYIVYCRAFYAPLEMTNFDNANEFATDEFDAGRLLYRKKLGESHAGQARVYRWKCAGSSTRKSRESSFFFAISPMEWSASATCPASSKRNDAARR